MEFNGIRKLKELLDKCLLAHATELCGSAPRGQQLEEELCLY